MRKTAKGSPERAPLHPGGCGVKRRLGRRLNHSRRRPNQGAGKRRGEIREAEPVRAAQSAGRRMPFKSPESIRTRTKRQRIGRGRSRDSVTRRAAPLAWRQVPSNPGRGRPADKRPRRSRSPNGAARLWGTQSVVNRASSVSNDQRSMRSCHLLGSIFNAMRAVTRMLSGDVVQ